MTELKETLPALESALPDLTRHVAGTEEAARAIETAAKELVERVRQYETSVEEDKGVVERALTDLRTEAAELEKHAEEEAAALESLVEEHGGTLAARHDALSHEIEAVRQNMETLDQHLDEAGQAAQAAHDQVGEAVIALEETAKAGPPELRTAVETVVVEAEELEAAVEKATTEVTTSLEALGELMTNLASGARDELHAAMRRVEDAQEQLEQTVQTAADALTAGRNSLESALKERIEQEIRAHLEEEAAKVVTALEGLAGAAESAAAQTATSRGEVETAIENLQSKDSSLTDIVSKVKTAAEIVGLVWGI